MERCSCTHSSWQKGHRDSTPFFSFCTSFMLQTTPSPLLSSHPAQHGPCSAPRPPAQPQCSTPLPETLRVQVTTALFVWVQGCSPGDPVGREVRRDSFPTHCSSPSQTGRTSPEQAASVMGMAVPHCNSLQTTSAALGPKCQSQTVFHWPPSWVSTRPEHWLCASTSWTNSGKSKKKNGSSQHPLAVTCPHPT